MYPRSLLVRLLEIDSRHRDRVNVDVLSNLNCAGFVMIETWCFEKFAPPDSKASYCNTFAYWVCGGDRLLPYDRSVRSHLDWPKNCRLRCVVSNSPDNNIEIKQRRMKHLRRFSFSLRTFLIVSVVFSTLVTLNLRPAYPHWRDRSAPITGYAHTTMRQYGWPFGCVDAYETWEWSSNYQRVPEYRVQEVRWWPAAGNAVFAMAVLIGVHSPISQSHVLPLRVLPPIPSIQLIPLPGPSVP